MFYIFVRSFFGSAICMIAVKVSRSKSKKTTQMEVTPATIKSAYADRRHGVKGERIRLKNTC